MNDNNEISVLLADIPQSANALGQPAAPVTLAYFADLQAIAGARAPAIAQSSADLSQALAQAARLESRSCSQSSAPRATSAGQATACSL